jgi:hypothetical protein
MASAVRKRIEHSAFQSASTYPASELAPCQYGDPRDVLLVIGAASVGRYNSQVCASPFDCWAICSYRPQTSWTAPDRARRCRFFSVQLGDFFVSYLRQPAELDRALALAGAFEKPRSRDPTLRRSAG